jgi:hypothetical protein
LLISHQAFRQELDRDFAIKFRILREINLTHSARAEL